MECKKHEFKFGGAFVESTAEKPIYHGVAYSVCKNCGEVRKNNV